MSRVYETNIFHLKMDVVGIRFFPFQMAPLPIFWGTNLLLVSGRVKQKGLEDASASELPFQVPWWKFHSEIPSFSAGKNSKTQQHVFIFSWVLAGCHQSAWVPYNMYNISGQNKIFHQTRFP